MSDALLVSVAYRGVRERICEMLAAVEADAFDRIAPATPEWRVRDVVAHLVGVTADINAGNLAGVASDPWTAAQVEARREDSVPDMVAEWSASAPQLEAGIDALPIAATGQLVFDVVAHEHDLRNALDVPGARDSDAVAIAFDWIVSARVAGKGSAIEYATADGVAVAGVGDPLARLTGTRFEILRAVSGRRTGDEIRALGFTASPEVALGAPIFTLRETSLGE